MHEAADLQHASSANPPARVHHALTTCLVLDVLHGDGLHSGSTAVRQWRQKRVLMRPEAAFPYVSAAEGAQHPPKKPPRSTPCRSEKNRRNERTAAAKITAATKRTATTKSSAATKKPVLTLRSSSAAPGRAQKYEIISKGIGITLPEASYGFRQNCRNRESAWP